MGKWMRGVFTGGLLGLVAGLLFAPQKGEETRKQLQDAMQKAKKVGNEVKEKGGELVAKAKQKIDEALDTAVED